LIAILFCNIFGNKIKTLSFQKLEKAYFEKDPCLAPGLGLRCGITYWENVAVDVAVLLLAVARGQ
jgi:hypothetical protein